MNLNRREFIYLGSGLATLSTRLGRGYGIGLAEDWRSIEERCWQFIVACRQENGGYAASPDPAYPGNSDTSASDLAAVTYAATLAKTLGKTLPEASRSIEFVQKHQLPDGSFVNQGGNFDPKDPLAILYNTTQGVVALRALGGKPLHDPLPSMEAFLSGQDFTKLPLYTTSFFPLFFAAIDRPFPEKHSRAIMDYMLSIQAEDGYLQDHVAATFHMAHFYRLMGESTPGAERMVARTLRDQTEKGGWDIKEPDWDVHACFDAVFILRQLGKDRAECRQAIDRAAQWSAACLNEDGGFGHYPGRHSDMDAVYFQLGAIIQAGKIAPESAQIPDAHTLSWGHAMNPEKEYSR